MHKRGKILVTIVAIMFPIVLFCMSPAYSYSVEVLVEFNGQTKNGLTATKNSEEFQQFFRENISAIVSENRINKPIRFYDWGDNQSLVSIGDWIKAPCYGSSQEEVEKIGKTLTEAVSEQWYVKTADYYLICGDFIFPWAWFFIGELFILILIWSRKTENSTKENEK